MTTETLSEEEKMRRVPGIIFVDGAAGRRARIAGTRLEVFEIIKVYQSCECDQGCLADYYDWLTTEQLQAALTYYKLFIEEIDARLALEAELTPEVIQAMYPWPDR